MSTLPQILPSAGADTAQPEPGEMSISNASGSLPGLFEKMMASALSPSKNGVVPSQPTPAQSVTSSIQFNPKSSGKFNAKSAGVSSDTDKSSSTQTQTANTAVNSEISENQLLASGVLTAIPVVNPGLETLTSASSVPPKTGATSPSAMTLVAPLLSGQSPTALTEVLGTDFTGNQNKRTAQPLIVQNGNPLAVKEAPTLAESLEPTALTLSNQTTASGTKTSVTGNQMIPGAEAFSPKETVAPTKNPEIPVLADPTANDSTSAESVMEAKNSAPTGSNSNISSATPLPPGASGTSIAKQDTAMNQAEKTNKIAGQAEKVLPGSVVSASRTNLSSFFSSQTGQVAATANPATPDNANTISAGLVEAASVNSNDDLRARTLERTQDLITLNATRLSDSGNNSMQVVIKPDAGTQLSLELRQQGGTVQVQAVLQQGDFNHLNQQWPELQQRLDQRGIQLAPLTDDGTPANSGGSETFQEKQNQTNVVPELTLVEAPTGLFTPEAVSTSAHPGWETWA